MDGIQLEKLYVSIEAQTAEFNKQMAGVNSRIDNMSSTVSKATKKTSSSFSKIGKTILAAFSISALIGFGKKLLEMSKQTEAFKKTLATAFTPLVDTLQPVLEWLVRQVAIALAFINGLIIGFFPKLAKGSEDSKNKIIADNNAIKRSYAGFDELNVLSSDTSTASPITTEGLISQEEIDKLTASGKAFAEIAKWFLIIVGIAAGLYIFSKVSGAIEFVVEAFYDLGKAADMAPVLSVLWDGINKIGQAFFSLTQGAFGGASMSAFFGIAAAIALVTAAIIDLWQNNEEFKTALIETWDGIVKTFETAMINIQPIIDFIIMLFGMVWEYGIKPLWDGFKEFVKEFILSLVDIWNTIKPFVDFIIIYVAPALLAVLAVIVAVVSGIVTALGYTIGESMKLVGGLLRGVVNFVLGVFTGDWKKAWEGLGKVVKTVADSFGGIFKAPINGIIDLINGFIKGINSIKLPDWLKYAGLGSIAGKGFNIGLIPRLANGGMPDAGSLFVAGESGAEMIGSHNGKTTVMPLENTSFVGAMKQAMVEGLTEAMSNGGNGDVIIQVGEIELGRAAVKGMNKVSMVDGTLGLNY